VKKIFFTLTLLAGLLVANVYADGAVTPRIRIESAKIVSEGAWFYMDVTNVASWTLNITMLTPFIFEEMDEFDISEAGDGLFIYVPFLLAAYKTVRFHFHASSKLHGENSTFGIYPIEFYIEDWRVETFKVQVVSLKCYEPQQNAEILNLKVAMGDLKGRCLWYERHYEESLETIEHLETLNGNIPKLQADVKLLTWTVAGLAAALVLTVSVLVAVFLSKKQ